MADPLSTAAAILGLIQFAQELIPPLLKFVESVKSFSAELGQIVSELSTVCGILCILQPVVTKVDSGGQPDTGLRKGFPI
jgi:hypothetical protein